MTTTCAAATTWPEVRPHGVRLACCLPAGHDGEHACAEIEYLPARPTDSESAVDSGSEEK